MGIATAIAIYFLIWWVVLEDRKLTSQAAHLLQAGIGHGLHGCLSRKQNYFNYDTPLTTAETASVFGEFLVFDHLLSSESDPRVQLALHGERLVFDRRGFGLLLRGFFLGLGFSFGKGLLLGFDRGEDAVEAVELFGLLGVQSLAQVFDAVGNGPAMSRDNRAASAATYREIKTGLAEEFLAQFKIARTLLQPAL